MELSEINSLFNDKNKQLDLIKKFQPGFLKFEQDGKIEINRTVPLNINIEKIIFSQVRNLKSSINKIENNMDYESSSKSLINSNVNISKSIKNIFNINLENKFQREANNIQNKELKSIHYQYLIYISLIKMSIPQNEFKLDENIKQEFRNIMKKKDDNEKLKELLKIYNKYGVGVPFEVILGGKYYIYFDAKNNEEKEEIVHNIDNFTKVSINEQKMDFNYNDENKNQIKNKKEKLNIQLNVVGGNPEKKDNYNEWLKSLNLNNLEIIEYKSLIPLHEFCEDIKDEVENLLERENTKKLEEERKAENERNNKIIEETRNQNNNIVIGDEDEEQITLMFLGDNNSGKTCIIKKYIKGTFSSTEKQTISQKFEDKKQTFQLDGKNKNIKVNLVDNAVDSERLNKLNISYISGGDGIVLVWDISNDDSFKRLNTWKILIDEYKKKNCPIFLIPNKSDLKKYKDYSKLKSFCEDESIVLMPDISCKEKSNEKLEKIMCKIVEKSYIEKKKKPIKIEYKSSCFG